MLATDGGHSRLTALALLGRSANTRNHKLRRMSCRLRILTATTLRRWPNKAGFQNAPQNKCRHRHSLYV